MIHVRQALEADLPDITGIYNDAVLNSPSTFDTEPKSLDDRRAWFAKHDPLHPILVAVEEGSVLGWGSLTPLGSRPGWRYTVEDSVYVRSDARGRGVGKVLLAHLVEHARRLGHHAVIARVVACNQVSIRLHAKAGFEVVGTWREVGRKFDTWLDLVNMQILFEPGRPPKERPDREPTPGSNP